MAAVKRINFTTSKVEKAKCDPGKTQTFLWDSGAPGLGLRVTQAGSKAYVLESRVNGKTLRITIGDPKVWTLGDAQAEARRLQTLCDQGSDPRELAREKAAAKAAEKVATDVARREEETRRRYTLGALCLAYADHLKAKGKNKTATDARSAFNVHVIEAHPEIAQIPAREVTSYQLAMMIRKVREAGKERTAGILRNYLVAAFNTARRAPFDSGISSGLIEFEVMTNPAEIVPAIAVRRGDRTLTACELQAYMDALGSDAAGQALRVGLLAGGQRMAQLLRAKVSDYDSDAAVLRLLDGKGKRTSAREHLLPLGPKAAALIQSLIVLREGADDTLFEASERTVGNRVAEICAAMNASSFDLRDIRRTVETMLASMRVSKDTRAQLLSHGISGIQAAHYDRHDYLDEKRAALLAWEARLEEIETGKLST